VARGELTPAQRKFLEERRFAVVGSKKGSNSIESALLISLLYTALFVPFTFMIDRFSYNRWQRRGEAQGQKQPRKR